MTDFTRFVTPTADVVDPDRVIAQACACLDRFTAAFNNCDLDGMDRELHFPHIMFSASDRLVWDQPGSHPSNFFEQLLASGWQRTSYDTKLPVLISAHKVHFVVTYARYDRDGNSISRHTNLWIVTRIDGRWGIALRSY